jgi:hypothetical protein
MSSKSPSLAAGVRVEHSELGIGVFIGDEPGGYARVFFRITGSVKYFWQACQPR